jgi:hypothetical protein
MKRIFLLSFFVFSFAIHAQKGAGTANGVVIAFWNVENLYDTVDDPLKDDGEFTPTGKLAWTSDRYHQKINNLSRVISEINSEVPNAWLGMIGLCEIENINVLNDLVNSSAIRALQLLPLLIDGPDARGVDVALLYRKDFFDLKKAVSYNVMLPVDTAHKTRGILVAEGFCGGQPLCIIVNHWPSRRGGETASRPNRIAVATKVRSIYDSIILKSPAMRVIIMGDLNDDPVDISVRKVLFSSGSKNSSHGRTLFNPMEKLFMQGLGTLAWRDNWNLFDQILLNSSWDRKGTDLIFADARIYNKKHLMSDYGNYRNYPFRTYSAGAYTGGYSDHFPVFLTFKSAISAD